MRALFLLASLCAAGGCFDHAAAPPPPQAQADALVERKVDALYGEVLGRAPTSAERGFWAAELSTRSEAQVRSYVQLVTSAIAEVYHRPPTRAELARFTRLLDQGVPL
jgi:hypothetical protein